MERYANDSKTPPIPVMDSHVLEEGVLNTYCAHDLLCWANGEVMAMCRLSHSYGVILSFRSNCKHAIVFYKNNHS
jgi:hypothetical protein